MFKRFALPAAVVAMLAGGAALGAAIADHDTSPDQFTIYDHDDLYWIYARQTDLCDAAQRSINLGNTEKIAIANVEATLPDDIATDDAVVYLRGMLHGCVDWGA